MKTLKLLLALIFSITSLTLFAQIKGGRKDSTQHLKVYTCPKHDTVTMKKPGHCPICGMKLNLSAKEAAKITTSKNYVCPSHPKEVSDQPGKCTVCGMNLNLSAKEKAHLKFSCPMHPNVKSGKNGKCPNCGMALTPAKKA